MQRPHRTPERDIHGASAERCCIDDAREPMMQETLTFPAVSSPHHRSTFSQSSLTDYSEKYTPESTPFVSAPSSPGRFCEGAFYFSAPTSPHWSRVLRANHGSNASEHPSSVPLHRDKDVGTPCRKGSSSSNDEALSFLTASDFEFSARFGDMDDPSMSPTPMSSANELFCNGQIRPLRIPISCMRNPSSSSTCSDAHGPAACSKNADGHTSSCTRSTVLEGGSMPLAFEFSRRRTSAGSSQMSVSAPQSPRFHWSHGCHDLPPQSATSDLSHGNSSTSISAPQSPRFSLNKAKGVLCGLPPGAFSQKVTLACSIGLKSHGSGHRRVRSFSPLTIFHRSSHQSPCSLSASSSSCIRSPSARLAERQSIDCLSPEPSTAEKQHEGASDVVQKSSQKKWTLKDLLHRKSGGENRWSSSRSSSHHSGASADSASSAEKMCRKSLSEGRSSSESFHSFASVHSFTKSRPCTKHNDIASGAASGRSKILHSEGANGCKNGDGNSKGPKADSTDSHGVLRTSPMKGVMARMQKSSKKMRDGSSNEAQRRSSEKARSEKCIQCNSVNDDGEVQLNSHQNLTIKSRSSDKARSERCIECNNVNDGELQLNSHQNLAIKSTVRERNQTRSSDKARSENRIQCNSVNDGEVQLNSHQNLTIKSTVRDLNNISKAKGMSKRGQINQKGWISPHEIHYMMHKQHTHELRKKTFLPYRQELLGCLGFTSKGYRSVTTISKALQSVSG